MKKTLLVLAVLAFVSSHSFGATFYWDSDADPTGNDTSGTGLGAGGAFSTWDNLTTSNWWDGTSVVDSQWDDTGSNSAIFIGTAGTVTIPVTETRIATSLAFNTSGYVIAGGDATSKLSLSGPATITVDPGVIADVSSIVVGTSGYSVGGGGTFRLIGANANTITGPVSVSGTILNPTTLEVASSTRLGGTTGAITLDGGTLRNNDNGAGVQFTDDTRNIIIGSNGGTFENTGTPSVGIHLYAGTISGTGNTLTKAGTGEVRMTGGAAQINTFQKLIVKDGGRFTMGHGSTLGNDKQLGAVPATPLADAVTLNNGILRFAGTLVVGDTITTHANRGIYLDSGGGTFQVDAAIGAINGKITGPGNLTRTGTLLLTLNNTGNDYAGSTTITNGTIRLGASGVLPDSTAVVMPAGTFTTAQLDVNGFTETIGSLAGGGTTTTGQVNLGSGTLSAGGNNSDTLFSGLMIGTGTFIKEGTGTMTFNRIWTNTGGVVINGGKLRLNDNTSSGLADTVTVTINENGTLDMGGINNPQTAATAVNDIIGDLAGSGKITGFISNIGANNGLRITGAGTTTFSGVIEGDPTATVVSTAQLRVIKTGGSLTLTGNDNTWEGGVNVSNGKLFVNNNDLSKSGTGAGNTTISGSATAPGAAGYVGGTGKVGGTTNVNSGGHLVAGNGNANEILTTVTVNTAAGSHIEGTIGTAGNSDVLRAPTFTPAVGTIITANPITNVAGLGAYTIVDSDSNLLTAFNSGNFYFNNGTGYDATLQLSDSDTNLQINVGSTPQDKTWNTNATGNWSATPGTDQTVNWTSPGQPNGPGATARFGSVILVPRTVTISDSNKTVGTLIFDNSTAGASYTITSTLPNRLIMNTYSGNALISVVNGNHTISAPMILQAHTEISVASGRTLSLTVTNPNGSITNNGGMTKTGAGILLIQNEWIGSGAVNINQGTLLFGNTSAGFSNTMTVTIASGATLDMANGATNVNDGFGDLAGDGTVADNNGTTGLTLVGAGTTTFNGLINGSSRLTVNKSAGSINLTNGSSGYGGGTTVSGGTLFVNNTNVLGSSATGGGSVTVNGTGVLGGAGRIGGAVTIASGGTLAPGNSIGTLTTASTLTLSPGSILNFELDTQLGVDVSDQVDVLANGGLILNGGTLNLFNAGSMTGGTYTLINYVGTPIGQSIVNLLTLGTQPAGFSYSLVDNPTNTSVDLVVGVPGDYDGSTTVDAGDYVLWRMGAQPLTNEVAAPLGTTNGDDYDAWRARFGNGPGPSSVAAGLGNSAAVPEPTTIALFLLGLSILQSGIRRRH